ncbi:hypothetical protein [Kribbella sp. CA-293567]|uniref:hypothetical protein n=1 Tax=Kribbella sp. CA-293567 TaxID=3002436 RepID=UPI0022DD2447|nr:hypothetical protein [Kribbella sp. CA-293567]WBQ06432.1 hypothetical protein OX958_06485 [Kribbella sp. CA-293567]
MTGHDWAGRPGFDAWGNLSPEVRKAVLAAGDTGWATVFDNIATYNETWRPLRPVLMQKAWLEELYALSDRMLQLVLDCCRRRAATAGELRKLLGIPDDRVEFVNDDEPLGDHLVLSGRPDILLTDGVPKIVEFNIGSDVGSVWDSERVSARFLELFRSTGVDELLPVEAPPSAVDGRYAAIREAFGLPDGARLTMVFRTDGEYPESRDPEKLVALLQPFAERGRELGFDMDVQPLDWLELDESGFLVGRGRRVETILRLFVCSEMPPTVGLQAIKDALQAGTASLFTSAASWLISNKLVFAWLWEDADQLPPEDADLIRTHLPRTRLLTAELLDSALAEREQLVLKPTDEFGGSGVVVGRETTPEEWRRLVEHGVAAGLHLVQDYSRPDRMTMDFVHLHSGEHDHAEVPFSIGPYTFGRQGFGCYVRIGSQGEGEVLNLKRNVHVTGSLLLGGA